MGWSRIPKTDSVRAGKHWLANLEPTKDAKRRKQFEECKHKIEWALASDKEVLNMFVAAVEMARLLGKADGMREGLELYEYGLKFEGKTAAFRAVMRYAVSNAANPEKLTTKEICAHLDRELERIKAQGTAEPLIGPPEKWGCETWSEARKKKRNNVDVLFSEAKAEARTEQFATLMAWATWGKKNKQKERQKLIIESAPRTPQIPQTPLEFQHGSTNGTTLKPK